MLKKVRADLLTFRRKTTKPKTLEWQVHLYDFILSRENPDAAADLYLRIKNDHTKQRGFAESLKAGAEAVGFKKPFPEKP